MDDDQSFATADCLFRLLDLVVRLRIALILDGIGDSRVPKHYTKVVDPWFYFSSTLLHVLRGNPRSIQPRASHSRERSKAFPYYGLDMKEVILPSFVADRHKRFLGLSMTNWQHAI